SRSFRVLCHPDQGPGRNRSRRRAPQTPVCHRLDNIPTGLYAMDVSRAAVAVKAPEATRRKLLEAAFGEFYANGFQGGSLNHIVGAAGATKGALFHHYEPKQALGYAFLAGLNAPPRLLHRL